MFSWKPITAEEFHALYAEQYEELNEDEREWFNPFRVDFWRAIIRRSEQMGDEHVFVVAQLNSEVLYFDDVEYGFNVSEVDEFGRILTPGGSQDSLKGALLQWLPKG